MTSNWMVVINTTFVATALCVALVFAAKCELSYRKVKVQEAYSTCRVAIESGSTENVIMVCRSHR